MTTLIIDDDPLALKLLTLQLNKLGVDDILAFETGESALARLNENDDLDVDLVMCDLQMPGMDGVEFVRHLGELGYTGSLILVSGESIRTLQATEKLAQAYQLNISGYLQKPVKLEELKAVLDKIQETKQISKKGKVKQYSASDLQQAITNKDLINFYQPKVSVSTGKVIGVESLVRWQHATDGMVFPDQFISLAEEENLIDDLTDAVLQQAAIDARNWFEMGINLHMAVNVSMDNLTAIDFPEKVVVTFFDQGIEPSQVCLEITESKGLTDSKLLLDILTRLRLKGVELSIDDFGTGHSSLVQLRNLPFDELKLDRSFVHGAVRDKEQHIIFKANVDMAKNLGLRTVAEGAEDIEDWQFLRNTNVDLVQGYFIARPMPASEIAGWIEEWHQRLPELLTDIEQ